MTRVLWLMLVAALSLSVACGDDDGGGGDSGTGDGDSGGDGDAGDGDAGDGDGDTTGDGDAGDGDAPLSVTCGAATCTQAESPFFGLVVPEPCCFDEAAGTCGLKRGEACEGPVEVDARCPAATITGNDFDGCCTIEGQCGIDASAINLGCWDLNDLPSFLMGPPARACDDADAGM